MAFCCEFGGDGEGVGGALLVGEFLLLIEVALGEGAGVFEVELLRFFDVEVCHKDFEGFVVVAGSVAREAEDFRLCWLLGLGGLGWGDVGVGAREVEVPVVPVHLANHVGAAAPEHLIKVVDLVIPAAVGSALAIGE